MKKTLLVLLAISIYLPIYSQNQEKHKAIVKSFYEYLGEKNELELAWALFDPNARFFQVGEQDTLNLETQKNQAKEFMSQFKDTKISIIKMIAEGDKVMAFTINRSIFVGKSGTENKLIEFVAADWFTFNNGKIIRNLYLMDVATMRKQLAAK